LISERTPSALTPTVATTGTPNSAASRSASMAMPLRRAISVILSATTIGIPSRFKLNTNRRFCLRLVASVTQTTKSGVGSPTRRPSSTSAVTCSSGVSGSRL
jgi:hypothetical protein